MATRLSYSIRSTIISKLISHRFKEEIDKLEAERLTLGEMIYNNRYSPEVQKDMSVLPRSFFRSDNQIRVSNFGEFFVFGMSAYKPFSYENEVFSLEVSDEAYPVLKAYYSAKNSLKIEKDSAREKANSILNSCSTIESLLKKWPEIKPFIPEFSIPCTAVAFPLDQVNSIFKLPKIEASNGKSE